MNKQELTYWVTLALMPKIWTKRKNVIYINCFNHDPKISIVDLFEKPSYWDVIGLSDDEKDQFKTAYEQLTNNSFMVEDLLFQGYEIIPIHSDEYPKILKDNLKIGSPTVIFTKGDKKLLQEPSIAIVGSRKANDFSLNFTRNVARKASFDNKIVVSGFAKGVDRQALDSALESGGKSIIVLPQGIMTFSSGFKQYFKYIAQGRVLVMSCFAPKAPWSAGFAMARNPIIYGMASEIFVAQSEEWGGTWDGATKGLKNGRTIYVRFPEEQLETHKENANIQLIHEGASPVDIDGNPINITIPEPNEDLNQRIISMLSKNKEMYIEDIIKNLNIDWKDSKMKRHLESMPQVQKNKTKNKESYCLKNSIPTLL